MRFYLKKIIQWSLGGCVTIVLLLNLYKRDVWVYDTDDQPLPWGPDFKRDGNPRPLTFDGPKIHEHVHRDKVRTNMSISGSLHVQHAQHPSSATSVYYSRDNDNQDRIVNQLAYIPPPVREAKKRGEDAPLKSILLYHGFGGWQVKKGQETFIDQKCGVQRCELIDNKQDGAKADAVLFHHNPARPWFDRPQKQIWILFMLESPYHTAGLGAFKDVFNWTATYRHDSTIVAPYEKFVPYNSSVLTKKQDKNYSAGKSKMVAWFVSNCGARNGRRNYADELSKHVQVDIYGACGKLKCPRYQSSKCFDMLNKDYKFYLAFENSNCRDYITEKFFVNGLQHDVIPIVMGGSPSDYRRAAPPHSFIHVDDFESPSALAEYLKHLDQNEDLYNEYFLWKGTGSFINTFFWCRICSLLHDVDSRPPSWFSDVDNWWRGPHVCIGKESWRNKSMELS
ncbi:LOW QUALITY PROTEIN: glycoprotein 3-alpha-L-fucosyltransferase A-like [Haliotis cracherodii]|uniref:LOW QUALITY PROTEIN: glycoprotein 3-alpha-L-fucosyltransferase A-like n=1 Tax=Haliotis cracherodii TaxID=6455 RepID=UPI0039E784C0